MGRVLDRLDQVSEFELTEKDFKFIQWFMHKNVGIFLSDRKRNMVYGRVSRKLREKGLKRFSDYRHCIESCESDKRAFINALTTNKTHFFRELHHIEFLEHTLVPLWRQSQKRTVSIWSAGCSTGEEPYSYLAALSHSGIVHQLEDFFMLASDLDSDVLATARAGIYDQSALDSIPNQYLKSNFLRGIGEQQGKIKAHHRLQQQVAFKQINLLEAWPIQQKFDLISCRNVMIYFDKQTQAQLIERFYHQLNPEGWLFIGHSESVADSRLFQHVGKTIYRKVG